MATIFEACKPRPDILAGAINDADFAADLAKVLNGSAAPLYQDPAIFFANTHPTRGLKNLLANVFGQLAGGAGNASSIFRLDTNYGGGKTHALIALAHVASGMSGVANVAEFLDPSLVPAEKIRVAAFDGENADPLNGRDMGNGIKAHTPWGELAYALNGPAGYESVRKSDEGGVAPGAETIQKLIGNGPALILLDELSIYLRKAAAARGEATDQLTAFLTALFKAVEVSPRAALVYTLAIGKKDGRAVDAYARENEKLAERMAELMSVSARKATLLDPTEEDETVQVLRRRLFMAIDEDKAREAVDAYIRLWDANKDSLADDSRHSSTREKFYQGYPLHPELMDTLTEKTATIGNFQRVRGMLRILARMVERLWQKQDKPAYALHLHHVDPAFGPIRQEILTRWEQGAFTAALKADIAASDGDAPSLAEQMDAEHYAGRPAYAEYAARAIFLHSLAFNDDLKGASEQQLRYSILAPDMQAGFVDDAIRRFRQESAYLDDRPGRPLRFLTEPNLNQIIGQRERQVDAQDVLSRLKEEIKNTFRTGFFASVFFPALPNAIEDNAGKPALAVLGYEATAVSVGKAGIQVPDLAARLFQRKNAEGVARLNVNNLVFLVADEARVEEMKAAMRKRLALEDMQAPDAQGELAPHQKEKLRELYKRSSQETALAIQQTYRHIFYPSADRLPGAPVSLNHAVIEVDKASCKPGDGQSQVIKALAGIKLRFANDAPDSVAYLCKYTPLKNGLATTQKLHDEYRQNVALSILEEDSILAAGIRNGIKDGALIYRHGELLCGKDDPWADIQFNSQAEVMTMNYARDHRIWPRQTPPPDNDFGMNEAVGANGHGNEGDNGGVPDGTHTGGTSGGAGGSGSSVHAGEVKSEGLLKEALVRIRDQALANKFIAIAAMSIQVFEVSDGFTLLALLNHLPDCDKKAALRISYTTPDGSICEFNFEGSVRSAQELKNLFEPLLRAAQDKSAHMVFDLGFPKGLSLEAASFAAFTEKLTRVGAANAYVAARARGQSEA